MDPTRPDSAEELMRGALGAHQQGHLDEAESLYGQLLELAPNHAEALRLGGIVARQRGDISVAIRRLTGAADVAPEDADCLSELGLSFLAGGDLQAAEAALRGALERDAGSLKALANLGAVLQYRHHLAEAIGCYRDVLESTPDDQDVRANLASALLEMGMGTEALATCDAGLDLVGDNAQLLSAKGAILNGLERFEAAAEVLNRVVTLNSSDDVALINLAYAQQRLGLKSAAATTLERAVAINPDNARATADLINLWASGNQATRARDLALNYLDRHPGERQVLASHAFALRDAGDLKAAAAILDYHRLLFLQDIEVPRGFESLQDFNDELAEAVDAHPSTVGPVTKATRGGGQTGELEFDGHPALAVLEEVIVAAVRKTAEYFSATGGKDHPAMAYAADRWTLRAWGTVLTGGGHQIPHMHPASWLSGVYYVQLPREMDREEPQAGWLEFGLPPARWVVAGQPVLHTVEPKEGRIVLFPSYFFHRTRSFSSDERRISIAFDAVPTPL